MLQIKLIISFLALLVFSYTAKSESQYELIKVAEGKYTIVKDYLSKNNLEYPSGNIISIGFESDSTSLVIISFDDTGNPVKKVFTTSKDLIYQIIEVTRDKKNKEKDARSFNKLNQDGRFYFIYNTSIKSLWLYATSYPFMFPDTEFNILFGLDLLTFGSTVYGAYKFTEDRELGYGRVGMMNYGGELLGLSYPYLLRNLLDGAGFDNTTVNKGPSQITQEDNENLFRIWAWTRAIGYPIGIYLGSKSKLVGNRQYGNLAIMRFLGRSGLLLGQVVPMLFEDDVSKDNFLISSSLLSMALIPAGNYLGYNIVNNKNYSSGRSLFIETTGILGALTGALLTTLTETENINAPVLLGISGHFLGTILGFNYHSEIPYKFSQGAFMTLSTFGGAAIALSVPLIGDANDHQAYTIAGLIGAWGGLLLGEKMALNIFESDNRDSRNESKIKFPIATQWPVLFLNKLVNTKKNSHQSTVEFVSFRF